jgi:hypothetical protein
MGEPLPEFDPEFAEPPQWAAMYRACGWPVVPAWMPAEHQNFKHPKVTWRHYHAVIPQADHDAWYAKNGMHTARLNMGVLTGGPYKLLMIDLDTYKSPKALAWWREVIETENHGIEPETVRQRSGGGGQQLFFQVPAHWCCPNAVTDLGVDIRCDGGFAMLPPSLHDSGNSYAWEAGFAPWEVHVEVAGQWLLDAVESLIEAHGHEFRRGADGGTSSAPSQNGSELNEWGKFWDHRERVMFRHVWHQVLEWAREPPGPRRPVPFPPDWEPRAQVAFEAYVRKIDPAAQGRERGWGLYRSKWRAAMRQWGSAKMIAAAEKPAPKDEPHDHAADFEQAQEPKVDTATGQPLPLVLTAAEFLKGFKPASYYVDGVLQRGYAYCLTARTGHGKTAVALYLGVCVARGVPFHSKRTKQGSVLFLAGENPDDVRTRFLVMADVEGFDPETIPFHFIDGVVSISNNIDKIRQAAERIADLILVIVDTQAAYFPGDEPNNNAQQGAYAKVLRMLTTLAAKPSAIINCHPIKNAAQDNLVPMGGSAFLNELDGNMVLWADDKVCTLQPHPEKWRGVTFESMAFDLETRTSDRAKDAEGRPMPSVIAVPITEISTEARTQKTEADENTILRLLHADRRASFGSLARRAGFLFADGTPAKSKVQRVLDRLKMNKFIYRFRGNKYRLTKKGCKEIGVKWGDENEDE